MSRSHVVALIRILKPEELREFVEAEGEQWQDNPELPQGVIVEGKVWLFLRGIDNQPETLNQLDSEEIEQAEQRFGVPAVGAISIDHTKATEGDALAERISKRMVELWGGMVFSE